MHLHQLTIVAAFATLSSAAPFEGPVTVLAVTTANLQVRSWVKPTWKHTIGFCGFPGQSCWGKTVEKDRDQIPPVPVIINSDGSTTIPVVPSTLATFGLGPPGLTAGPPVTLIYVNATAEETSEIRVTISAKPSSSLCTRKGKMITPTATTLATVTSKSDTSA